MTGSLSERWTVLKPFLGAFGVGASLSLALQVLQKRRLIRTRVRGISTPVYWRRHNSDLPTMYQTFGRREADIVLDSEPKAIMDLGANIGTSSLFFANKYAGAKVLAVEPEHENCETFRLNCGTYRNVQLVEGAVWISNTRLEIQNPNAASWEFRVKAASEQPGDTIKAYTMDALVEMTGAERIDLLKMDVEGAEKEIFESSFESWLPKVGCLLVETHDAVKPGCEAAVRKAVATRSHTISKHGEYLLIKFKDSQL